MNTRCSCPRLSFHSIATSSLLVLKGICCTPSTSVAIARPVGAIHRAETMSGISFETGEGGGGVLLGGSGLGEGSLGLASLCGLLLGSSNLSVARLLSSSHLSCALILHELLGGLGLGGFRGAEV